MSLSFQDPPTLNDFSGQIQSAINAAVTKAVNEAMRSRPAPVVNVAPPNVNVAAPNVNVKADVPDIPTAEIDVTVPGMSEFATQISGLRNDLAQFVAALMRPTVREVKRDGNGRITQIIDRRT